MQATGLTEDSINRKDPLPYIGSFLCAQLAAGMTRHILASSGIEAPLCGLITGLGLGAFVAAPWIATNVLFQQKPRSLIWMDGAYPNIGMTLMGLVLTFF